MLEQLFQAIVTLDFETDPIENRPAYPPRPAGLSVKYGRGRSHYMSCGHPVGNNSSMGGIKAELEAIWASGRPILFQNAKFDLSICYEVFGMPKLPWWRIHDTMFLSFLSDPHALSHGLKQLAEKHLSWPPEEKDAIGEWVWEHRKQLRDTYPGIKIGRSKGKVTSVWRFFALVPATICGPYAEGDTDRTFGLFCYFYPHVLQTGMQAAYDRERELMPILYENEVQGMRVDRAQLEYDVPMYRDLREHVADLLRDRLGDSTLNIDSDAELAAILTERGLVAEADWQPTKSGAEYMAKHPDLTIVPPKYRSVSKDNLLVSHFTDPSVFHVIGYYNRLGTALKMFMEPWLAQSRVNGDMVSTHWNQTRGSGGGTRTGRPSTSDPNFLNISKSFEGKPDRWEHPEFLGIEQLPLVRDYVLADSDEHLFLHRDFDGQELRVFANYENGPTKQAFIDNPEADIHQQVADKIKELFPEAPLNRTKTKVINFQSLYGGGAGALSKALPCSMPEAKEFKSYHDKAMPGRKVLVEEILRVVRRGEPVRTWGGRRYFPEEPRFVKGRGMQTWEYKLINYIIQGSAADITKQAIIDWYNHPDRDARFLVTVYDEINISAHQSNAPRQMEVLRESMEQPFLDITMNSSGKFGSGWGKLQKGEVL